MVYNKNNTSVVTWKRRYKAFFAMFLAMMFVVGVFFALTRPLLAGSTPLQWVYTPTQDIENARREREQTQSEIAEAERRINQLSGEVGTLRNELAHLNDLNEEQRAQYLEISQELAAALIAKREALNMYLDAQRDLEQKTIEYSERISVMFEFQNKSTLEILLESNSLAGFFTNLELIELIGEADRQIVEAMQAAMDEAQLISEFALQEAEDMQMIADAKEAELLELEALIGETEATLQRRQAELTEWERKQDELETLSQELGAEIARLQQQLYSSGSGSTTPPPQGSMTWPYPGDYRVYSGFGMRYHPILRINRMHNGVDLGGVFGNPIVAASDGTVIRVETPVPGQNRGGTNFGNYVVIDHGGGVSTWYAHCKDVYVSVGDVVVAGQTIATCGSTGLSSGPHLHFEVRINGTPVNPLDYIT